MVQETGRDIGRVKSIQLDKYFFCEYYYPNKGVLDSPKRLIFLEVTYMKKNLGAKPYIYPQPVLIVASYDEDGIPNAMNVAYGGIVNSNRLQINIGVSHKSAENIKIKGAFTIGIADEKNLVAADYVGIVSGENVPYKLDKTGWKIGKSEFVNAPVIEDLPITMECKVEEINQYGQTLRIVAIIENVLVDDELVTENDGIDLSKFSPICYDPANCGYLKLGEKVGDAFKDGNKIK